MELLAQITQWNSEWGRRFPIRITKKQKAGFLREIERELQARHFATERVTVRKLLSNQLLMTVCERPKIIFLAHYDTPTIMPFWFSFLFRLFGHTRQIIASIFLLGFLFLFSLLPALNALNSPLLSGLFFLVQLILSLSLFSLLIPNPHNHEDNTSGIIGLMALADWLQDKPALQAQVQFVFLDNEEWGLLGSSGLRSIWDKTNYPYKQASLINLDCISRGQKPLLVYHRNDQLASRVLPFLQPHLPNIKMIDMGIVPLSDNYTFKDSGAVDITYTDPALIPGGYHVPQIHVPSDIGFYPDRLLSLIWGLQDFVLHETGVGLGT